MTEFGDIKTQSYGENDLIPAPSTSPNVSDSQICAACGTLIERRFAKYCRICGKFLFEKYQPLDNLRASYRMQGKAIISEKASEPEDMRDLFETNKNARSQTTWACFVYSLVPYIGIIFIPMTFFFGTSALIAAPKYGGKKLAVVSMILSFFVLAIQLLLWWLLYFIPTLNREF